LIDFAAEAFFVLTARLRFSWGFYGERITEIRFMGLRDLRGCSEVMWEIGWWGILMIFREVLVTVFGVGF
jgi:hypothetical protein